MTATSSAPQASIPVDREISVFELATPLVYRWRLIAGTALTIAALAAVLLFLERPMFTAKTTFTPETPVTSSSAGGLTALAGVASQLGFNISSSSSVSPEFFVKLAASSEVLRSTLLTEFPDPKAGSRQRPLLDILEVKGRTPEERLQKGVILLRKRIKVSADKPTAIVALDVDMRTPELAAGVANRLVGLLNTFNLERRQSQSREQARFTGERLAEAEKDLRAAEGAELAFLQRNRDYTSSPLLTYEAARLSRDVQVKQELFLTLSKAHTEARIAEVRDTPVLTVVDSAVAPFRRSRPQRLLGVILALILGTIVGVVAAYVVDFRKRAATQHHPDYLALQQAWAKARQELGSTLGRRRS